MLVPDYQLSLAIGKRGQNARLAARLTGFKIDIKPESERDAVVADMANKENEAANAPVIEADVADDFEASEEA